jgi:predicted GIY-YIG superfamily endonuclease
MATAAKTTTQQQQCPRWDGVYLLAFYRKGRHVAYGSEDPRGKAAHYLGWAQNIEARIAQHRAGRGGRLPRAVMLAGYELRLVRTWPGATRQLERALKDCHRLAKVCPVCAYRLGDDIEPEPAPSSEQSEAWRYWMNGGEW